MYESGSADEILKRVRMYCSVVKIRCCFFRYLTSVYGRNMYANAFMLNADYKSIIFHELERKTKSSSTQQLKFQICEHKVERSEILRNSVSLGDLGERI